MYTDRLTCLGYSLNVGVGQGDEGVGPGLRGDRLVEEDAVHGATELQLHLPGQSLGEPVQTAGGRGGNTMSTCL